MDHTVNLLSTNFADLPEVSKPNELVSNKQKIRKSPVFSRISKYNC